MKRKVKHQITFQDKVLGVVCRIPFGQVRSYAWVARKAGSPKAVRAVGQTLKKNPYPLIVPCHRVIKSDGTLGGYAGGKKMKENLLNLERFLAEKLKVEP